MNTAESSLFSMNYQILVLEIAVVLAIAVIVIWVLAYRKHKKMKGLSHEFLAGIRRHGANREEDLNKKLTEITDIDGEQTKELIDKLVISEKKAYLHIAQLYMGHKPESLVDLENEIEDVFKNYIAIIGKAATSGGDSSNDGGSDDDAAIRELKKQVTNLREEKKSLKIKNAQLQIDFEASVDSIERMTTEFANMYEGGSKDGDKRIKNEMYQLRQILAKKMDATSVDGDFDSDLSIDEVPDMEDISSGSEEPSSADIKQPEDKSDDAAAS